LVPIEQRKAEVKKAWMMGLVVVILLLLLLWWMDQQSDKRPVERNRGRASKQSTGEMARNLYKRLEKRGNANPATMRSLKAIGRAK
jgi:hypothetical protein